MSFMRFSAAPAGRLGDRALPWAIYGDRAEMPDGLEDNALAGANLASIASSPGAPMFEKLSLFGAHVASLPLELPRDAPVVVFVHGFGYEPRRPVTARVRSDNPHRCLYHFEETPDGPGSAEERAAHTTPWFARAMLAEGQGVAADCTGLAVGYSYSSRGGTTEPLPPGRVQRLLMRAGLTFSRRQPAPVLSAAYHDAEAAGHGLAALLAHIRYRLDEDGIADTPIDIFCHGLGARTVLRALATIARRWPADRTLARIGRVVMLNGACYWGQAAHALATITFAEAPDGPSFYNVTSRQDDLLRYLAGRPTMRTAVTEAMRDLELDAEKEDLLHGGHTIGFDGAPPTELWETFGFDDVPWIDLPLDGAAMRDWGRRRGLDLRAGPKFGRGDHWTSFTHPGNWGLYRAILHRAEGTEVHDMLGELY